MKTKLIFMIFVVAVVAIGYNVYTQNSRKNLSILVLDNIEALANDEAEAYSCTITRDCGTGNTVSCTGEKKCEFVTGALGSLLSGKGVRCDGHVTWCP